MGGPRLLIGSSMTALAEVDLASASPEIAGIYADIARLSGIPLPALIWRHLATFPGVLPEAWAALRPLYERGLVQRAAWETVETVVAATAAGPTAQQLASAGLPSAAVASYRQILQSYNRANPVNFVGVRILLAALSRREPAIARALPPTGWTPPAAIVGLVPMTSVGAIPPKERQLIDSLAVAHDIDRSVIVPSLYRHLVPWPLLLQLIHAGLAPRIGSGAIGKLVHEVSDDLRVRADDLADYVGPLPTLAANHAVTDALESFSRLIPEMIVIGTLLVHGLDLDQ